MWRETNIEGIFFPPLLVYLLAALVILLALRLVFLRLHVYRWVWNPSLAEAALYVCILGALIALA